MTRPVRSAAAAALVLAAAAFAITSGSASSVDVNQHIPPAQLTESIQKYAQVKISIDRSVLSKPEMDALGKLVQAGGWLAYADQNY